MCSRVGSVIEVTPVLQAAAMESLPMSHRVGAHGGSQL